MTANTADATIQGLEAEVIAAVGDAATVSAFLGYTDGAYNRVRFDLNGDGSTVGDRDLALPRLAKLTYGVEAKYARQVGDLGRLSVRLALSHRDDSEITDDNRGVLDGGDLVDASVGFAPSDWVEYHAVRPQPARRSAAAQRLRPERVGSLDVFAAEGGAGGWPGGAGHATGATLVLARGRTPCTASPRDATRASPTVARNRFVRELSVWR